MKGTEVKNQQTLNDIKTRELLSMLLIAAILLYVLLGSDTAQQLHCAEKDRSGGQDKEINRTENERDGSEKSADIE